ncbi:MAG TPA: hypothetical protein VLD36_07395 [Burkholderiales bacterium]|nr:hypothetical protein [Burkholderiales bacterium]
MRFDAPLYEGDSVIRSGPAFGLGDVPDAPEPEAKVAPERVESKPETVFELNVAEVEARARAMRAAYIAALFGRVWERFEAWLDKGRLARDEAYLAKAENLADLEARMRRLERDGYVARI